MPSHDPVRLNVQMDKIEMGNIVKGEQARKLFASKTSIIDIIAMLIVNLMVAIRGEETVWITDGSHLRPLSPSKICHMSSHKLFAKNPIIATVASLKSIVAI